MVFYPIPSQNSYEMEPSMQPVTKLTDLFFWNEYPCPAMGMECSHLYMKNFANLLCEHLLKCSLSLNSGILNKA